MNIDVKIDKISLDGELHIPEKARGIVLFIHGSGSSRKSPRNQFVARALQSRGIGTLLIDLLTQEEEREDAVDAHLRFDIMLLAERVRGITAWLEKMRPEKIGYFGASTGAAAALVAAAENHHVAAIVSRGGRPDLAASHLPRVTAPTLLIVGGDDTPVIGMNKEAYSALKCTKKLVIIPGATHLFEEAGKLEEVAHLAGAWFEHYF